MKKLIEMPDGKSVDRSQFNEITKDIKVIRGFPDPDSPLGFCPVVTPVGNPTACSWLHTKTIERNGAALFDLGKGNPDPLVTESLTDRDRTEWKKLSDVQNKRMEHCLRRLRQKKLIFDTVEELLIALYNSSEEEYAFLGRLLRYSFAYAVPTYNISDETWMCAIEMTAFMTARRTYMDAEAPLVSAMEQNLMMLYMCTVFFTYSASAAIFMERLKSCLSESGMEEFMTRWVEHVQECREFAQNAAYEASENAQTTRIAEQKVTALETSKTKLEDKVKRLEKELLAKNVKLRALSYLDAISEGVEPESDEQEDEDEGVVEIPEQELLDLPEEDVWFVGGNQNLVNRVAAAHPGWRFIESGDDAFVIPKKCSAVFVFYKHISHKIYNRVKANMPGSAPLCYVKRTNAEELEREMREQYTAAMM